MAKKCKCPEPEGGDAFMTTFADMVTLLLCFFVLLFSMATIEEAKFVVLLKGLEESFGNTTIQSGLLEGGASIIGANMADGSAIPVPGGSLRINDSSADSESEGDDVGGPSSEEDGGPADKDQPNGAADSDSEYLTVEDLEELQRRLEGLLAEAGRSDDVNFRFDERGLVISVASDDVLFPSASAEIQDQAGGVLEIIAPEIASFPNTVFVDGHTDNVPFPGTEYTNRELSAERAVVVTRQLEDAYGIDPLRLIPAGYGEWRPIAENDTDEGRALNRRVELVVAAGEPSAPLVGGDEAVPDASTEPTVGEPELDASTPVEILPTDPEQPETAAAPES